MPLGSGISAQFGYAAESTWGTSVTPDHFVDFNDEGLSYARRGLRGWGCTRAGR
jgi:hypothetical protein